MCLTCDGTHMICDVCGGNHLVCDCKEPTFSECPECQGDEEDDGQLSDV